jgi:hypothetical protein
MKRLILGFLALACIPVFSPRAAADMMTSSYARVAQIVREQSSGPTSARTSYKDENGSGVASVATNYGINRCYADAVATLPLLGSSAEGISRWDDEIKISGGAGSAKVTFGVLLDGALSGTADVGMLLRTDSDTGVLFFKSIENAPPLVIQHEVEFTTTFHYGAPFTLISNLSLNAYAGNDAQVGPSGKADFFNTAILNELILPRGAPMASASGTIYPLSPVPEPPSLVLTLLGAPCLIGLYWVRWLLRRMALTFGGPSA